MAERIRKAAETGGGKPADRSGNRPVDKVRIGDISATIWEQQGFYNATLERNYQDRQGEWKSTHSFGPKDLVVVAKVADMAADRMTQLRAAQERTQEEEQELGR